MLPRLFTAVAIFSSSSGHMSGQNVNPKYSSANFPSKSFSVTVLLSPSTSWNGPPIAALPAVRGWVASEQSNEACQLKTAKALCSVLKCLTFQLLIPQMLIIVYQASSCDSCQAQAGKIYRLQASIKMNWAILQMCPKGSHTVFMLVSVQITDSSSRLGRLS